MTLLIILIVISNYVYLLLTNCKTIKIKHIYTYLTTGWMKIGWEEKKNHGTLIGTYSTNDLCWSIPGYHFFILDFLP